MWNLFGAKRGQKAPDVSVDASKRLFVFLSSQINKKDLIKELIVRAEHAEKESPDARGQSFASIYLAFEHVLVTNKPDTIKREYSKDELRDAVCHHVDIHTLPLPLALVFFDPKERTVGFFVHLMKIFSRTLGEAIGYKVMVDKFIMQLSLADLRMFHWHNDTIVYELPPDLPRDEELKKKLRDVFGIIIEDAIGIMGKAQGEIVLRSMFHEVEATYNEEMLPIFFDMIPPQYLSVERLSYLSREELANRVQMATQAETQKRMEAEELSTRLKEQVIQAEAKASEMEMTKKAMLNLLEDSRELESTLKIERDRATAIVSSMGEGLYVVDTKYRVILVNRVAEESFGLPPGSSVGKKLSDITTLYKDDKELAEDERPLFKTIQTGEPLTVSMEDNYAIPSPHGKIPIVLSTAALKKGDTIIGGLVTFHDVTKDKEVKHTIEHTVEERTRELKQEQARFTASIRSLELGYILTDSMGAIVNKNPAADSILGLKKSEKSLQDIEQTVGPTIPFVQSHENVKKEGKPHVGKNIIFGAKHVDIFTAPIFIDERHSEFLGSVIVIQDVTEAKVLERSRDEFFSIASHELRTPLTAIRGNTSMILEYFAEQLKDPELKEMVTDVHESSIRLINIVNDFLQTSRLEQGRLAFKNEAFDIAKLITEVLKEYDVTGSRKKLYLKFEPPQGSLPQAFADKDRVKEILINLVGNALKFTEEGGVTIRVHLSDDFIRVVVEDTGRGIPYENQMLLFHKFQQASDSLFTRDTTRGTGLGLYISKLMIEGMGGTIGLQSSQPGKGSAFGFALPVVGSAHAVASTPGVHGILPEQTVARRD